MEGRGGEVDMLVVVLCCAELLGVLRPGLQGVCTAENAQQDCLTKFRADVTRWTVLSITLLKIKLSSRLDFKQLQTSKWDRRNAGIIINF